MPGNDVTPQAAQLSARARERGTEPGLAPYVCDLHARWLAEAPERRWRAEPGTLVFFDVSGFTPLTERLAARGKVGGEELTDVLSTVFGALLGAAEALGGDTLKFGGDAVFILFEGAEHERRASAAAFDMQARMRTFRRLKTSAGVIALGASCGVATGPVHAFLVGEIFREMVIAGPTTSAALAMESAAQSGQILVDRSTQPALADGLLGAQVAAGRLLSARPQVAPPRRVEHERADAALGLPPALAPYLLHTVDGEHRQGVVAFLQFKGLDALLETEGPPVAADALSELIETVQRCCEEHRITFLDTDCDRGAGKVFLTTGSPVAEHDDADRMLLGLRAMLGAPRRLAARAGVNRGRVFAVHLGAPRRRTYTTMGDTTNVAARVMGKAPDGGLLATHAVLDAVRAPFTLTPVAPFAVKGKTAPISGAVVGDLEQDARARRVSDEPFVGRERELAILSELLDAAAEGRGGAVELVGEAGIGKSRLVDAACSDARRRERAVIVIDAHAYGAHTPYAAVRSALREWIAGPGASDDAVQRALTALLGVRGRAWLSLVAIAFGLELPDGVEVARLDPQEARARLHLEMSRLLAGRIAPGTLVVVDNAQWVDEPSSDLLASILNSAEAIATVVSRRDGPGGLRLRASRTIELGPLAAAAVDALVHDSHDDEHPLPPAVAAAVVRRANGNPLFLGELLAAARAGHEVDELPDSVEELLAARIDVLAPGDRAVLREAAVLGSSFDRALLEELAGLDPARLREAVARLDAFIVDEARTLHFRQALARDAAYEALPYRTRRRLHGRARELIEARAENDLSEVMPLLSLHADAAGDVARSWRFSRIAGDQAARRGATIDAVTFLRRALQAGRLLDDLEDVELAEVATKLGDAAERAGLYAQADAAYREARRRVAGDPVRTAELCRRQGWLRERTGSYSQALRWYGRAMRAAGPGETPAIERIHARLALAYGAARLRQGRLRDSLEHLATAASIADRLDDRPTLAHASYLLDWAHTDLGRPVALYRERALRIYEELEDWTGLANVLNNLGVNAFFAGDWQGALGFYERSRQARERGGDVVRYGEALVNVGELLVDQGRLDEAEPQLRSALALWRGAGFPVGIGVALMNLGRIAARRGRDDDAADLLGRARTLLDEIGSEQAIDAAVRDGEHHVLAGRASAALEVLDAARTQTEHRGGAPVLLAQIDRLRAYALAQIDEPARAMDALRASRAAASGTPYEEALTLRALTHVAPLASEPVDVHWAARARRTLRELGVRQTWPAAAASVAAGAEAS